MQIVLPFKGTSGKDVKEFGDSTSSVVFNNIIYSSDDLVEGQEAVIEVTRGSFADYVQEKLRNGALTFAYRVKKGGVRVAHGTTCLKLIPEAYRITSRDPQSVVTYVNYWDFERSGWRRFDLDRLIVQ